MSSLPSPPVDLSRLRRMVGELKERGERIARGQREMAGEMRRAAAVAKGEDPAAAAPAPPAPAPALAAEGRHGGGGHAVVEPRSEEDAATLKDIEEIEAWLANIKLHGTYSSFRSDVANLKAQVYKPPQARGFASTTDLTLAEGGGAGRRSSGLSSGYKEEEDEEDGLDLDALDEAAAPAAGADDPDGGDGHAGNVPDGVRYVDGQWVGGDEDDDAFALDDISDGDDDADAGAAVLARANSGSVNSAGTGGGGRSGVELYEFEVDDLAGEWASALAAHDRDYGGCFARGSLAAHALDTSNSLSNSMQLAWMLHQAQTFGGLDRVA